MKIDKAIEKMKQSIEAPEVQESKEVKEEALIEPFSRKHTTGKKLIDSKMRSILLKLAEKYFFYDAVCAKAGIYRQRLNEELTRNKDFGHSFAYARHKFIAHHQQLLLQYAKDKREKDWRAEKYILTIADREYSERKYLTEAVANQDAKITMIIDARQLEQAKKEGMKLIGSSSIAEPISLKPFSKTVKNKGQNANRPSVE